jgi:hypothetical protein
MTAWLGDPDVPPNGARTYSLWFRVRAQTPSGQLYFRESCCRGVTLSVGNGRLRARHGMSVSSSTCCGQFGYQYVEALAPSDKWLHATFIVTRSEHARVLTLRVYNADQLAVTHEEGTSPYQHANSLRARVGASWNGTDPFTGDLAALRVFDGAETAEWSEVQNRSMRDALLDYGAWEAR